MPDIGLILLAAGGSTRMGRAKQLLVYRGKTLLRRAADAAVGSGCTPIVVVVGADAAEATRELAGLDLTVEVNPAWERGMGTSLRAGLARLLRERPDATAVVVTL